MSKIKTDPNATYTREEHQAAMQELAEQAELVESQADMTSFAKSAAKLASAKVVDSPKKKIDGDDTTPEDDDTDPYGDPQDGDPDADDANDPGADVPAQPVGRKMEKSLKQSLVDAGVPPEALESGEIIEAVSEVIQENNKIALESQRLMRKSIAMNERISERLDAIESAQEQERAFNKSARSFLDNIQRTPVGTPSGSARFNPSTAFEKSASTAGGGDAFGNSVSTLRGLNENQLIKGLTQHLNGPNAKDSGLNIGDLNAIGVKPMHQLNPKIAEIAAAELGIELSDS